jgi:hypothetical protein
VLRLQEYKAKPGFGRVPSKCKALGSISSTTKTKQQQKQINKQNHQSWLEKFFEAHHSVISGQSI